MIRHLVLLRFQIGVSEAEKQTLYCELAALSNHIEGIVDFQHRKNKSVETPLVRGYMDMFWFDLRDSGVRTVYLDDPVHQEIGSRIVAILEGGAAGVIVCDIEL